MTLDTEVQSLKQVPMFRDIDPARLKLLAFTSERVQFAPGQRFFAQGDPADAAYVVLDGRASVSLDAPGGEIHVAELETTTALRIDKRVFLELLTHFPQMSIAVMRELAGRLERTNAQLAAQSAS